MPSGLRSGNLIACLALAAGLALLACGTGEIGPAVTRVRPSSAAPGELLLVSGRGFRNGDVVAIDGRPVAAVTWVNDGLLTATVPEGLTDGSHALEVRSLDGRRAAATVSVSASPVSLTSRPAAVDATAAPRSSTQPASEGAAQPRPSPPQVVAPAGRTEDEKKAEERVREEQKRLEEQRREQQKREDERKKRDEEKKRENEKKREEQGRR